MIPMLLEKGGISIHALREEGDVIDGNNAVSYEISIHALREEGDIGKYVWTDGTQISIHALREEGDMSWGTVSDDFTNFYPRPPRGGRHMSGVSAPFANRFLSTPSARRAT